MTTWRAKLGFLVPSSNSILERDARLALPDGVSAHFARMKLLADSAEELGSLIDKAPEAADSLADAEVDAIAFGCTTGSLLGGLGYDQQIIERIESTAGVPATTTSTAVVHALQQLGLRHVVLISPYEDWLNEKVIEFLRSNGIDVGAAFGFALPEGLDAERVTPDQIRDVAIRLDSAATDGIFVSCTSFRGLESADSLERTAGKPVVTSNQATFWELLTMVRVDDPVPGFGSLLTRPRVQLAAVSAERSESGRRRES